MLTHSILIQFNYILGAVIPQAGGDALHKVINSFLSNPGAAATALGLTRVKRGAGRDDAYHFKAAGVEVEFDYHNQDRPREGGKLSLSLEESVVEKIIPDLKSTIGKVKLAIDFKNSGSLSDPNFELETKYEVEHHGYNEKALFTILRNIDNKSGKIHTSVDLEHLSVPPLGKKNLIPSFLFHSDELTFVEGNFIGPHGRNHEVKAQLDMEKKNIQLKSNAGLKLKLNWEASTNDVFRCKAILVLNVQYDADFHFQKRAYPSFGLNVSTGDKSLFTFDTIGVVEPNLIWPQMVKYELRYKASHFPETKLRFSWESAKRDRKTGATLSKEQIKIQYLPKRDSDFKMIIEHEGISNGIKISTEITKDEEPYLSNMIEITDHKRAVAEKEDFDTTMSPYYDKDYLPIREVYYEKTVKFSITTKLLNKNLKQKFGLSTNKIQGEATNSAVDLYLEVTNDGQRYILYKINLRDLPYGVDIEIYNDIFMKYLGFCPFNSICTIKVSTSLDTTTPSPSRQLNILIGQKHTSYSLTGTWDTDFGKQVRHKVYLLSNFTSPNTPTFTEEMNIEWEISESDAKLKVTVRPESSVAYAIDIHGNKYLTDAGLKVYVGKTNIVSLAVTGDLILYSSARHVNYELMYKIKDVEDETINSVVEPDTFQPRILEPDTFQPRILEFPDTFQPGIVEASSRFKVSYIGEGKLTFSWQPEKRDRKTGAALSKEQIKIQYLPKSDSDFKMIIEHEGISNGMKISTKITKDEEPYLNNMIAITDHEYIVKEHPKIRSPYDDDYYNIQSAEEVGYRSTFKFNITTKILNRNVQQKIGLSTNKIQVEAAHDTLYLEVTNDDKTIIMYKILKGLCVDIQVHDHYFFYISDAQLVITPNIVGETYSLATVINLEGEAILDEKIELTFKPAPEKTVELTYKCHDYKNVFQEVFQSIEVNGRLKLDNFAFFNHTLDFSVTVDDSMPSVITYNTPGRSMELHIKDTYLLPEIYGMAGWPRKNTFIMKGIDKCDKCNVGNLISVSEADFYLIIHADNKAELRNENEKLVMAGFDRNSAEVGIYKLPNYQNQSVGAKVSWRYVSFKAEYELKISGLETHIKLDQDYSKDTFKLEAKGENYWLGKYDITREGFIKAGDTQLEGRWTGVSSIENAPWPSPVHTEVDFDFPYREDPYPYPSYPSYSGPPPSPPAYQDYSDYQDYSLPPSYATLPPSYTTLPHVVPKNYVLNISKKALGKKFTFAFNNGRISLDL